MCGKGARGRAGSGGRQTDRVRTWNEDSFSLAADWGHRGDALSHAPRRAHSRCQGPSAICEPAKEMLLFNTCWFGLLSSLSICVFSEAEAVSDLLLDGSL